MLVDNRDSRGDRRESRDSRDRRDSRDSRNSRERRDSRDRTDGGFKKSQTEISSLSRREDRGLERMTSHCNSGERGGDIRSTYELTVGRGGEAIPPHLRWGAVQGEEDLVRGMRDTGLGDRTRLRQCRPGVFTPQPERREPVTSIPLRRYDSPLLEGHRFPRTQPKFRDGPQQDFSSPRSERGIHVRERRERMGMWSPARSDPVHSSPFPSSRVLGGGGPTIRSSPFTPTRLPTPTTRSSPAPPARHLPASPRSPPYTPAIARNFPGYSPASPSPGSHPGSKRSLDLVQDQSPSTNVEESLYARPGLGLGKRSVTQLELTREPTYGHCNQVIRSHPEDSPFTERILRKGLLWVQHDKLFSRWKEKFIIITSDYLQVFKKASSRISEMGPFQYKIRVAELTCIGLEDRKGYLTLAVTSKQGKMLLRRTEGISEWGKTVEQALENYRARQERSMASTDEFWNRKQKSELEGQTIHQWLRARDKIGQQYSYQTPPPSGRLGTRKGVGGGGAGGGVGVGEGGRRGGGGDRLVGGDSNYCSPSSSSPGAGVPLSSHYFSPTSPGQYKTTEDDSGFESLVTTNSDSGSSSSHQVALSPARDIHSPRLTALSPRMDFRQDMSPSHATYQNMRRPLHWGGDGPTEEKGGGGGGGSGGEGGGGQGGGGEGGRGGGGEKEGDSTPHRRLFRPVRNHQLQ